ncbi:MAG: metallophosphoesterase [Bdellovibrio sp.]|nr:metallophosphoesterase [Bdellovibrio sp.]
MLILIISDLHLGRGKFFKNGQANILEDFHEDDRFVEFMEHYSSGKYYNAPVHLVLNGDLLNLIQIDLDGVFTHIIDEEVTVRALHSIREGHHAFFEAIKHFADTPNKKITYVIGNHDAGMAFLKAQEAFRDMTHSLIEFCFEINLGGIHIEHGHRFEAINTVPTQKYFIPGPRGKPILNLPWGSLFCISLLPILKKERPYIDRVRPMRMYVKWCLLNDFFFFWRMAWVMARYFIESNFDVYVKQNRNFKTNLKMLKQVTIYPRYERKAKTILKKDRSVHTVIMGHTHLVEWRRFPEGKYYFNSGTWNSIPSIDAAMHAHTTSLTYLLIELDLKESKMKAASIHVWKGKWRPFREEVSTTAL